MTNIFLNRSLFCITTALLFSVCLCTPRLAEAADAKKDDAKKKVAKITYDDHIKPIFRNKCFGCHNQNKSKGDLNLTSYTAIMSGGASGDTIAAGSSDDSYLYSLITHQSEPSMPPEQDKLAAASLDLIKKWIDQGALENAGSKVKVNKPTQSFTLKSASSGRPAGPPVMPQRMSLEPLVVAKSATSITAIATSPWAPLVAIAGQKQVLLYNTKTLAQAAQFSFPEGTPYVLKFSRNGSLLLAGGGMGASVGKVAVWDVKTGKRLFTVGDELDCVMAADISSDQSLIALGGPHRVVRVYSTTDGSLQYEIKKHTDWITTLEFSPDSVLLATGDRANGLFIWEAQSGQEYLNLTGHRGPISDVSWRADSNVVASASDTDGDIKLWEMNNGKQIKSWRGHGGGTADIEFSRDGKIVSCGRDKLTRIWDQNGKALRAFPAFTDLALRVSNCDETQHVIAGDWTGKISVWSATDGKLIGELSANPPKLSVRLETATQLVTTADAEFKKAVQNQTNVEAALNSMKGRIAKANQSVATSKQQIATADVTSNKTKQLIGQTKVLQKKSQQQKTKITATRNQLQKKYTTQQKNVTTALAALAAANKFVAEVKKNVTSATQKAATDKQAASNALTIATASAKVAAVAKATKAVKAKAGVDKANAAKLQAAANTSAKAVTTAQATATAAQKTVTQKTAAHKEQTAKLASLKKDFDTASNTLTATLTSITELDKKLKALQKQFADAANLKKTALATNKKSTADVKTLTKQLPPYVVSFNKTKVATTAAQQKLDKAKAAVKTWQDELAFASQQKK